MLSAPRLRYRVTAATGPLGPWGPAQMLPGRACRRSLFDLVFSVSIAVGLAADMPDQGHWVSRCRGARLLRRSAMAPDTPICFAPILRCRRPALAFMLRVPKLGTIDFSYAPLLQLPSPSACPRAAGTQFPARSTSTALRSKVGRSGSLASPPRRRPGVRHCRLLCGASIHHRVKVDLGTATATIPHVGTDLQIFRASLVAGATAAGRLGASGRCLPAPPWLVRMHGEEGQYTIRITAGEGRVLIARELRARPTATSSSVSHPFPGALLLRPARVSFARFVPGAAARDGDLGALHEERPVLAFQRGAYLGGPAGPTLSRTRSRRTSRSLVQILLCIPAKFFNGNGFDDRRSHSVGFARKRAFGFNLAFDFFICGAIPQFSFCNGGRRQPQ